MGIGDIGFLQANPVGALTGGAKAGLQFGAGLQAFSNQQEDRAISAQARQSEANQLEQQRMLMSVARDAKTALGISDPIQRKQFLGNRAQRIIQEGGDPSDTLALIELPFEQQNFELQDALNQIADLSTLTGGGLSADQRSFEGLISGFSPEDQETAKRIRVGLDPRATGSAAQTISGRGTLEEVAGVESRLAESKASGKAIGEAKQSNIVASAKAEIAKKVKLATKDAESRGETLTELNKANASLPGLNNVVSQLKELAPIATSTLGGNVFDTVVKESGFGSTKGATAKAKFVSIINNQILPLLKQTFGAAFTKAEGDELKATMGNPDSSPDEKIAQLDAFIAGKYREIQSKERELGVDVTPTSDLSGENQVQEGQIIVNPSTGERLRLVNGQYVEVK